MILSYRKWKNKSSQIIDISQLVYQACIILHIMKDENFLNFYNEFLEKPSGNVKTILDFTVLNKNITVINFIVDNRYDESLSNYKDLILYSLPAAEEILSKFNSIDLIEWIYPSKIPGEKNEEYILEDIILYDHNQKIPIQIELEDSSQSYSEDLKQWVNWDKFLNDNSSTLNVLTRDWLAFFIDISSQQLIDVINKEYIENINWNDFKDYKFKKTFGYYLPILREKHFIYLSDLFYTSYLHKTKNKKNEWIANEKKSFEKLLVGFIDKDIKWDKFLKSIMLVTPNLWTLRNHGLYFNKALTITEWNDLNFTYKYYLDDNNLYITFSTGHELNIQFVWKDEIICGDLDIKIILR